MIAKDVVEAIWRMYKNSHAVVTEVGSGPGFSSRRRMDVVAIGLWPSRGLGIHAIEIKVSRADLQRELKIAEKAEEFYNLCDSFSLAVPKGLIREEDRIPETWGIIEVSEKGKAKRIKKGRVKADSPVDRGFFATVIARILKTEALEVKLEEQRGHVFAEGYEAGRADYTEKVERLRAKNLQLTKELAAFSWLGMNYSRDQTRDVIQGLLALGPTELGHLEREAQRICEAVSSLSTAVEAIRKGEKPCLKETSSS